MTSDRLTFEAQSVLDELWTSKRIPFQLIAYKVDSLGSQEYIVRFYDSRLPSVDVSWTNGNSFKEAVRVAVLGRAERITAH